MSSKEKWNYHFHSKVFLCKDKIIDLGCINPLKSHYNAFRHWFFWEAANLATLRSKPVYIENTVDSWSEPAFPEFF